MSLSDRQSREMRSGLAGYTRKLESDRTFYIEGQQAYVDEQQMDASSYFYPKGRARDSFLMGFQAAVAVAKRGLQSAVMGVVTADKEKART